MRFSPTKDKELRTEHRELKTSKPFYGWWMVGGAVICLFAWMGASQAAAGVFLKPVVEDLGWQVWQFTLGTSLAAVGGGLSGIYAGVIVDRHGPRFLIMAGALVTAACLWGLSRQSHLWMFLVLYAVSGIFGWNLFSSTVVNPTITKWFVRKRGWALALGSIGVSLASLIAPVTMTFIVDTWDWRVGYAAMGAFILVVVAPVGFIMRRTPEDYGLLPDGDLDESAYQPSQSTRTVEPYSFTRWEAVRTSGFWLLLFGFAFNMAALISILVHAIPLLTESGFSRAIAASALAVNGLGNLASKAIWGYGLQRVHPRLLVLAAFMVSATGVILILVATATGLYLILFPAFFMYGFGFGGTIPLGEFTWAKYFGRRHIGAIRGIGNPVAILFSGLGPILVGLWFDIAGTYQYAFFAIIASFFVGAVLVAVSREPSHPHENSVR